MRRIYNETMPLSQLLITLDSFQSLLLAGATLLKGTGFGLRAMWEVLAGPLGPDPEQLLQSSLVSLSLPDGGELLGEKWGLSAERGLLNREF